ncbi:MAG: 50S ribosomal protein L3 [Chloroflexi bacterium RBG_16_48_7]|nr:MAG: 50S ribosomal protein L3 [Chloroflexi bacterium RBG_16_48_7]
MIQGILGKKIGMTQLFRGGVEVVVTAIEAGPCVVVQVKTEEKDGYNAVQLGFEESKRLNSPEKGHLKKLGQFKHLREFETDDIKSVKEGQKVDVDLFKVGDKVDVIGTSKGKSFAGGVKRYHFRGGPKTHGQSDRWRAPGSVGSTTSPGMVLKGLRMAGHMGDARVTVKNQQIVDINLERHIILIKGALPGPKKGLVMINRA